MLRETLGWVQETPLSVALRDFPSALPFIEAVHILAIMIFAGTILMVDLRLMGLGMQKISIAEMLTRFMPWTLTGFVVMAATGLTLFVADPLIYYHDLFFRLKILLMLAALANILYFHIHVRRDLAFWETRTTPPASARMSAALSFAIWFGIIAAGRMTASDGFTCTQLPAEGMLSRLAECVTTHAFVVN